MRFSFTLGAAGPGRDPRALADLAALAEDSGWDGCFLEDYLAYQGHADIPTYDPWICLAAMAMPTTRIRLGVSVTPAPRRRPWKLAAEAMSLDHLSNGRLILGVGLGDPSDPFFQAVGEPTDRRVLAERLDETLTIVDRLWTGEPVWHEGRHYTVRGARLAARPVQRPRIPIWVGGDMGIPRVRERLARWDGSCAYGPGRPTTPDDIREFRSYVAGERGTLDGYDIRLGGGRDERYSAAEFADAGVDWLNTFIELQDPEPTRERIAAGPTR
jgi:alkanesulfonate monooxygenase SsuD/methylene tetrahydromethanopterin reductase-like flavin-dependent oxidoreductase (luciferase family)